MSDDELEALATAAGAKYELGPGDEPTTGGLMFWDVSIIGPHVYPALRRFAESVRAIERERCAKLCDIKDTIADSGVVGNTARALAAAIRATEPTR